MEFDSGKFKLEKYWFIRSYVPTRESRDIRCIEISFDVPKGSACVGNGLKVRYSPLSYVFLLCSDRSSGGSIYGNNGMRDPKQCSNCDLRVRDTNCASSH